MSEVLRVVLATGNAGKAREFGRLLGPALAVEAMPAGTSMPEETARTFAENARLKALGVARYLNGQVPVLADDSGLEVDALDGRPGVFSARFAGEGASDEQNVARLLAELQGESQRGARFISCLCLWLPGTLAGETGGECIEVQGSVEGQITREPRGEDGFGYDPLFRPSGWTSTLAEASPRQKDEISHRGAACRVLLVILEERGLVASPGADCGP